MIKNTLLIVVASMACCLNAKVECINAGPQSPRDITDHGGINKTTFKYAPLYHKMNLCNLHTHTNAEHKGPDYQIKKGDGIYDGYQCNDTKSLTESQLYNPPHRSEKGYGHVKPGDTIEVHWVFSSCDTQPGPGLGACVPEGCINPLLRVEAQVFLVVNDPYALDFNNYTLSEVKKNGFSQPKAIPQDTGTPIVYLGSTTGKSYNENVCSSAQVTWSVRPLCAKLNIASLDAWAEDNVFAETESHAVRQLVTNKDLLSQTPHTNSCG